MRKFTARSDRVKCVDVHPVEPWVVAGLYNGSLWIWNHDTQTTVKSFEVSEYPIRAARFIPRKSWVVAGGDELVVKVYNYHTFERVAVFEAHLDYIRSISVHPTLPYILTSSDEPLIKLWDWDRGWKNTMTFEGHTHFVMQIAFNPKDPSMFASSCLDSTVKVWNISSQSPSFTLTGHEKGVNCVDFYHTNDKPYLVSGADDMTIKVWDYLNKTCVATITGHTANISCLTMHPELPYIISGAEDGMVKVWNASTFKLEQTLTYSLGRVWAAAYQRGSGSLALGFDEGCVVIGLGHEDPVFSLDPSGKLVWARHNTVYTANLKGLGALLSSSATAQSMAADADSASAALESRGPGNGELINLALLPMGVREMGTCDVFPTRLMHSPNSRFISVTGDGEYSVYTALAWRSKCFGTGADFAWSTQNEFAVREAKANGATGSIIRLFDKQFKEKPQRIAADYAVERIYGGPLLGVKSSMGFFCFYDWGTGALVRRIDAKVNGVYWSESGEQVLIASSEVAYVLQFDGEAYDDFVAQARSTAAAGGTGEGAEAAFVLQHEIRDTLQSACWVGDCVLFVAAGGRLCYAIGAQQFTLVHATDANAKLHLLGYLVSEQRVLYCDKDVNVYSWRLPVSVINYKTAVLHGDLETAAELLPGVPEDARDRLAQFLEAQGHLELALDVARDEEHKFNLALRAGKLAEARKAAETRGFSSDARWKALGEHALRAWDFGLAKECMLHCGDHEGLLLLHLASGDSAALASLAAVGDETVPQKQRSGNAEQVRRPSASLAYLASAAGGCAEQCVSLLKGDGRLAEASLCARSYAPELCASSCAAWKASLPPRIASAIQFPAEDSDAKAGPAN